MWCLCFFHGSIQKSFFEKMHPWSHEQLPKDGIRTDLDNIFKKKNPPHELCGK